MVNGANVGMRYRGDIIKSKLPVVPADGAVWGGSFFDIEDDTVTPLSNVSATSGTSTPTTITSAAITDATTVGKNVLTANDAATARTAIGAGTSSFDGSYNSLKDKPTIPPAYTLPAATENALGGVKLVSIASNADAAAIVTALKSAGIAK